MPYTVSSTGLVHATTCHLADGEQVFARRTEALRRGRRMALCCLEGVVDPRVPGPAWF